MLADYKIYLSLSVFKLLLYRAYHSTDYDVHSNWKQITYSLPMKDWYFEATSVWTLDYPPFFAYFEYLLAQVQSFFVPGSMAIAANPTESSYLLTMRVSVILTDLLYYYACLRMTRALNKTTGFLCALYVNWGLVLIDNMHF